MNKNKLLKRASSQLSQSQTSIISQSAATLPFSMRKQSQISYQEPDSTVTTQLIKKISIRQKNKNSEDFNRIIPINKEITNVYHEFEENYKSLMEINNISNNEIQYSKTNNKSIETNNNNTFIKVIEGLNFYDLNTEKGNRVNINRFKFYYFRVRLKNRLNPIQLFFSIIEKQFNHNYKAFISTSVEFPTKFNCDLAFTSRSIKVHTKFNSKLFNEEYLYLTLYSETDFQINILCLFGELQLTNIQQKIENPIKYINNWEEETKQHQIKRDKIIQNLDQTKYKSSYKLKQFLKNSDLFAKKMIKVAQKAKSIEKEILEERLIKQSVKEQIQKFRKVEKNIIQSKQEKQQQCQTWMIYLALLNYSEKLFLQLLEKKRRIRIQTKARLLVLQVKTKLYIDIQKFGNNPHERCENKSLILLKVIGKNLSKVIKKKSGLIICKFLKKLCLYQYALIGHQKLLKKINFIINQFKIKKIVKKNFREKFWKLLKQSMNFNNNVTHFITAPQQKQLDIPLMAQLMDEYINERKKIWVKNLQVIKSQETPLRESIKIYKLPNEQELNLIIKKYHSQKKLM